MHHKLTKSTSRAHHLPVSVLALVNLDIPVLVHSCYCELNRGECLEDVPPPAPRGQNNPDTMRFTEGDRWYLIRADTKRTVAV